MEGDVVGKLIGDYQLLREIGRGQYGVVFLAKEITSGNNFAVKRIEKMVMKNKVIRGLFQTEVAVMHAINHPNILHLHKFMESQNNYYLIVDYCNQGDLEKKLRNTNGGKGFEEKVAVEFLKQIMNGFQELRKRQVLHRDFKLANIFLNDGRVVIGDFGFAKQGLEVTNTVLGTPVTMAYELLSQGQKRYNSKADLWSVGVVFFEMLFGYNPFWGETPAKICKQIEEFSGENLPCPRPISTAARSFLVGVLQKRPEDRLEWTECFRHPLFDPAKEASNPSDREFESNKFQVVDTPDYILDTEQLLQSIAPLQPKQVEDQQHIQPSFPSERSSQHMAEINFRFNHEKNISSFFISTFRLAKAALQDSKFSTIKQELCFISFLLLKKISVLNKKLLEELSQKQTTCGINSNYFKMFLESLDYRETLDFFEERQTRLNESFARFVQANSNFANMDKFSFLYNPQLKDTLLIDQGLREELGRCKIIYEKEFAGKGPAGLALCSLLAQATYCLYSDQVFNYFDKTSSRKFDWETFFASTRGMPENSLRDKVLSRI